MITKIYFNQKTYIKSLFIKKTYIKSSFITKTFTKITTQYLNFDNIFSLNFKIQLLKYIKTKYYFINFKNGNQLSNAKI